MTPDEFRRLAAKWQQSRPAPRMDQNPADYVVNLTAHQMARFLYEMANEDEADE